MKRIALTLALAVALVAATAPTAEANQIGWTHFRVENHTVMTLNYEFSFDGGLSWTPVSLAPGSWYLQWSTNPFNRVMVRFDADLGPGIAMRQYDILTFTTPYAPNGATPTMVYRLVQTSPQLLDLFRS